MNSNIKNQSPRKKTRRILMILILCFFALTAVVQNNAQTRSITSDDFVKQRPVGKKARPTSKNKSANQPSYKFVRQDKRIARRKTAVPTKQKTTPPAKAQKMSQIGVTMWKLRPPRLTDAGYKLPVKINDSLSELWTAERVSPDTIFRADDRVRFAVESSDSGYLYIINSEMYANGDYGEPVLLFPSSSGENNYVQPGLLVDIPDRTEEYPYFVIEPKKPNHTGELITIIVSPKPLKNLKTDEDGKIKNLDELIELEINADAEIYSRPVAQDKIYTQSEAEAACGSKTRELVKEKSNAKPCGARTRQLTREEPLPQTIYRVKAQTGHPTVAFVRLNVR